MDKTFRATLWFKKGELDALAATDAADDGDGLHPGKIDLLPVEDRYLDDGSVTSADSEAFSLRTGGTVGLPRLADSGESRSDDAGDVGVLVRDIKRGRGRAVAFLIAASAACAALLAFAF
jgi:hypothetical protein